MNQCIQNESNQKRHEKSIFQIRYNHYGLKPFDAERKKKGAQQEEQT